MATLKQSLPAALQKSLELAPEKGASAWLTTFPIEEHGFSLHKQAFMQRCTLHAYVSAMDGSQPDSPVTVSVHGAHLTTTHAFSYSKRAFHQFDMIGSEM